MRSRSHTFRISLAGWQKVLMVLLGMAFFISSLASSNFNLTVLMLPNLVVYLLVLFGIMAAVDTPEKLRFLTKVILVLGFILSLWRVELRPLRAMFQLPSLMINGASFSFHPAIFLALVILLFSQFQSFSIRWRWFAMLALVSMLVHGIQYETRGAWLSWLLVLPIILNRIPLKGWVRFIPVILFVGLITFSIYAAVIDFNYNQAEIAIRAGLGQTDYTDVVSKDDRFRLMVRDLGIRMFWERPLLGWGANTFIFLQRQFATSETELLFSGAFNAWLALLVEMGLMGALAGLAISLAPLAITWSALRKQKNKNAELAFGFALGVLAMVIHLLFIDLMFSFYWAHVALALAAARLALQNNSISDENISTSSRFEKGSDDLLRLKNQRSRF